jgi:broad specificity phosphatase PhoE
MKIYVIRHGQTEWNKNGIIQGQQDIELNETGIEQARNQIKIFNEYNFDLIISSTLKRAQKTAQIINSEKNVDIIYDDRLRERNFGDYEGTPSNFDEDPIYNLKTNIKENNIETAQELYNRVSEILDEIKEKYNDKKILLVTHGGTTRAIETYFNGTNNDIMPPETIKNCEIREYEYK